jgi:hypothetical protein
MVKMLRAIGTAALAVFVLEMSVGHFFRSIVLEW